MNSSGKEEGSASIQRIVHVAAEFYPYANAGGIGDVTAGLAGSASKNGIETHVVIPGYGFINVPPQAEKWGTIKVPLDTLSAKRFEKVTVYSHSMENNLTVHFVDSERFRFHVDLSPSTKREHPYIYSAAEARSIGQDSLAGTQHIDFFQMNVLLVKAALMTMRKTVGSPDIIHCHHGSASLLPVIAQASQEDVPEYAQFRYTPTVVTVHNAGRGYRQESEHLKLVAKLTGLPETVIAGCTVGNDFDPLLAGALFAHDVNTVSENYAYELQHTGADWATGWFGHTLLGRGIQLDGITNGVDPDRFALTISEALRAEGVPTFQNGFENKRICRQRLIEILRNHDQNVNNAVKGYLEDTPNAPLLTFVSRFDFQKGFDILANALEILFDHCQSVQLLAMAVGEEEFFREDAKPYETLAEKYPGRVCLMLGYDSIMALRVLAAGDFFIIPSRYEPCGLTDYYAQLVGNIPIAASVGGLVKIEDGVTGISYKGGKDELLQAIERAITIFQDTEKTNLRKMQTEAIKRIHTKYTWDVVFEKRYIPFYQKAIKRAGPCLPKQNAWLHEYERG